VNPSRWRPAYVGVGSNLDGPLARVDAGIAALGEIVDTRLVLQSSRYRSAPLDGRDQPDFVNAVVALLTLLPAERLLQETRAIEDAHGRDRRGGRWASRTLDLDLLALSDEVVDTDCLSLPHPGVAERNFVLLPWAEIAPDFYVPGLGTVGELAGRLESGPRIERLAERDVDDGK
jgi:2-amino-4-hydroxy-6-hydroxymethyldihydropteridine diphosphokinase